MPATPRRRPRQGFTLIELITVVAIIGILAAILIPVVSAIQASARTSTCISNLREIGKALLLHTQDHGGRFPAPETTTTTGTKMYWNWSIQGYTRSPVDESDMTPERLNPIFMCPEWKVRRDEWSDSPANIGYAMSTVLGGGSTAEPTRAVPVSNIRSPSQTILVIENPKQTLPYFPQAGTLDNFKTTFFDAPQNHAAGCERHNGRANYLFADGHVSGLNPQDAENALDPQ